MCGAVFECEGFEIGGVQVEMGISSVGGGQGGGAGLSMRD